MGTTKAALAVPGETKFEYWRLINTAVLPPPYPWKKRPAAGATAPAPATTTPLAGATIAPISTPLHSTGVAIGVTATAAAAPNSITSNAGIATAAKGETPKEYVKKYFQTTKYAPFGSSGKLAVTHYVNKIDVIRAAVSAGYGNRLQLNNPGHAAITVGMRKYLSHRLEMLLACLDYSAQGIIPKTFFEHVEATEKGALAFIAGCLGTHIAARELGWRVQGHLQRDSYTPAFIQGRPPFCRRRS